MRQRRRTSTPAASRSPLVLLFVLALILIPGGSAAADVPDTGAIEVRGPGTWGVAEQGPANATWLVIDGTVHAYSVIDSNGARFDCHIATLHSDPQDPQNAENAENGTRSERCRVETTDNGTYQFSLETEGRTHEGRFVAEEIQTLLLSDGPDAPSSLAGFIVSTLAALFLVTSIILLTLYTQERRVSHYLVRRLYEETKGRMPADWPENLRHQWIARIFIRGKN